MKQKKLENGNTKKKTKPEVGKSYVKFCISLLKVLLFEERVRLKRCNSRATSVLLLC